MACWPTNGLEQGQLGRPVDRLQRGQLGLGRGQLAHPPRMASELLLPVAPCWLLLLPAPQGSLLQRLRPFRRLYDKDRVQLALLSHSHEQTCVIVSVGRVGMKPHPLLAHRIFPVHTFFFLRTDL